MEAKIVIIPGLGGSGDDHWQSFWSRSFDNVVRIEQENWDEPELEKWLEKLNEAIEKLDSPVILVAHSLAVSLVLHWAVKYDKSKIKGALLVAPADVDSPEHTPDVVRGFAPIPIIKLAFPSIVVASLNDPYLSLNRAKYFAEQWGSEFINIGKKGHINSDSNLGFWEEGQLILQKLLKY
ncbi:RBBP9/YdeN family alpha/beta hydrolase [Pedobacter panaciterrae]